MKLRTLSYYINEAFKSLARNRLMSLASILTVFSCIFILAFSYTVASNIDFALNQLEENINLSVFLENRLSDDEVLVLFKDIEQLDNVSDIVYISHEEALEIFTRAFEDRPSVAAGLRPEDLPRSFTISLNDVSDARSVFDAVTAMQRAGRGIEEIAHDQRVVDLLTSLNTGIRVTSSILIVLLIVLATVIIMNTIRLTVNARRTEITIMKYIGATDWFIRWPFIIEGMLIGLIGSITPVLIVWFSYNQVYETINNLLPILQDALVFKPSGSIFALVMPVSIALGVAIGTYGSVASMRKHLQV